MKKTTSKTQQVIDDVLTRFMGMKDVFDCFHALTETSDADLQILAVSHKVKATPWNRELVMPVLKGIVQNAWYRLHEPNSHDWDYLDKNQRTRTELYELKLKDVSEVREEKVQRIKQAGAEGRFAAKELTYYTTKETPGGDGFKGQQRLIRDWFSKHKTGGTVKQITKDLVAGGFTCNQDPERAIYYYLNEWKKKGWLTNVEPGGAK